MLRFVARVGFILIVCVLYDSLKAVFIEDPKEVGKREIHRSLLPEMESRGFR